MFYNLSNKQKAAIKEMERFVDLGALVSVTAEYDPQETLEMQVGDAGAKIVYGKEHLFFKGLSYLFCEREKTAIKKSKKFEHFGIMLDCARNGVPTVEALKRFIVHLAFCGYDYIGLYLEDCFEVDGEPFFGYMRGRFSKQEIKEIVAYADLFGIEVVPYIQTLAHLLGIFRHWEEYFDKVRDFGDILLIDEPRTYALIDNMLKTVSETFATNRVNIGMDEAFMVSYGKYRKLHGETNGTHLLMRHAAAVCDLCEKYGLIPTAWADMFENRINDPEAVLPKNLGLGIWEYSATDAAHYSARINAVKQKADRVSLTSAIHKWYGYAPLNEYTETVAYPAMEAAEGNVDDFCLSMWGDDGAECSYNACWYSLFGIAARAFGDDETTTNNLSKALTGYSVQEWLMADLPNKVFHRRMEKPVNVSKYILFEDIFYSISDKTVSSDFAAYFEANAKKLYTLASKRGEYTYLFKIFHRLCKINRLKTGLKSRALQAYRAKDYDALCAVANDIQSIIRDVKALKKEIETMWLNDYKPFGLEIQQIRLAGLIDRLQYCRSKIVLFCKKQIDCIEELDEVDLSPQATGDTYADAACFNSYEQNVTYCQLTHKILY